MHGCTWEKDNKEKIEKLKMCPPCTLGGGKNVIMNLTLMAGESTVARLSLSAEGSSEQRCKLKTLLAFLSLVFFRKLRECYTEETSAAYLCLVLLLCYCLPGMANLPSRC